MEVGGSTAGPVMNGCSPGDLLLLTGETLHLEPPLSGSEKTGFTPGVTAWLKCGLGLCGPQLARL